MKTSSSNDQNQILSTNRLCALLLFSMLFIDIIFSVIGLIQNFSNQYFLLYAIFSSVIYIVLFSISTQPTRKDYKLYSIISVISLLLFNIIVFGQYLSLGGSILITVLLYSIFSYMYYSLRNKFLNLYQIVIINLIYGIVRISSIFFLIYASNFV